MVRYHHKHENYKIRLSNLIGSARGSEARKRNREREKEKEKGENAYCVEACCCTSLINLEIEKMKSQKWREAFFFLTS